MSPGSAGVHLLEGDERSSRKLPEMGYVESAMDNANHRGGDGTGERRDGNLRRLEEAFLFLRLKVSLKDFPGSPVAETPTLPTQEAWAPILVRN